QLERAVASAADRSVKRLLVERVHGEESNAHARDRGGRPLDRRLDVQQLGIDEYGAPAAGELLREREASREQELEPDLVDAGAVAERLDQRARFIDARHVEGNDQPAFGFAHGRVSYSVLAGVVEHIPNLRGPARTSRSQSISGRPARTPSSEVTCPGFC